MQRRYCELEPRPPKTVIEESVLDLAIQLYESKYSVQEALLRQRYARAVKALIKERQGNEQKRS